MTEIKPRPKRIGATAQEVLEWWNGSEAFRVIVVRPKQVVQRVAAKYRAAARRYELPVIVETREEGLVYLRRKDGSAS